MALSRRYATTLQEYLRAGERAGLQPALAMGRQAATLDLETLDLARMHEAVRDGYGVDLLPEVEDLGRTVTNREGPRSVESPG